MWSRPLDLPDCSVVQPIVYTDPSTIQIYRVLRYIFSILTTSALFCKQYILLFVSRIDVFANIFYALYTSRNNSFDVNVSMH